MYVVRRAAFRPIVTRSAAVKLVVNFVLYDELGVEPGEVIELHGPSIAVWITVGASDGRTRSIQQGVGVSSSCEVAERCANSTLVVIEPLILKVSRVSEELEVLPNGKLAFQSCLSWIQGSAP